MFSVVCFLLTVMCYAEGRHHHQIADRTKLDSTLVQLEKTFAYILRNREHMDVNVLLGVVVSRGQLSKMNQENPAVKNCLRMTRFLIEFASRKFKGIHIVYDLLFSQTIWMNIGNKKQNLTCEKKIGKEKLNFQGVDNSPNGTQSDLCLSELSKHARKVSHNQECNISSDCLVALTSSQNPWGYELLHRILFNLIATAVSCEPVNSNSEMCCRVMDEVKILWRNGIPFKTIDLFIEEILICSLSGYQEFLQGEWTSKILSWQNPNGCWWDYFMYGYNIPYHMILRKQQCTNHTIGIAAALLAVMAKQMEYSTNI